MKSRSAPRLRSDRLGVLDRSAPERKVARRRWVVRIVEIAERNAPTGNTGGRQPRDFTPCHFADNRQSRTHARRAAIDRSPHGVEPTLYGQALRKLAVTVFDDMRQAMQEIEFLANPTAGEVRIGCDEAMTGGLVAAAIDKLSQRHPRLVFHMEGGSHDVLQIQSLRERKCDLVVARHLAGQPDLDAEVLFHEQLLVWVSPNSKWLCRRKIGIAELVDEPRKALWRNS
jgi:hypothetical protein